MLSAFHEEPALANKPEYVDLISHATRQKWRRTDQRGAPGQGTRQGGKAAPQQLAACPLRAVAAGKPDAVEILAEVLDIQGLELKQRWSE
jgi:hypothetical protein